LGRYEFDPACRILVPFQGTPHQSAQPRVKTQVETLGFYEAEFVKTRCEKSFILVSG
jgi:hypothetical protein